MADDLLPLIGNLMEDEASGSEQEDSETEEVTMSVENSDVEKKEAVGAKAKKTLHVKYDSSLPGVHSYLGNDLEDLRGRTIHEEDKLLDLPVLSLPGVVLVPGQTIPLSLFQPQTVAMVRNVIEKDKTFGLVTARYDQSEFRHTFMASIGTTAEIFSIKDDMDEQSGISTLRVKARGRQRFEICETNRQITGVLMAKVRILPERHLPPPLEGATPFSHAKLCGSLADDEPIVNTAVGRHGQVLASVKMSRGPKIDRFSGANFTWWPPWVYKMYDEKILMRKIKDELQSWNDTLKPHTMPSDPVEFSYWVAQNLPVEDSMRLFFLSLHSAVQRLRCELSVMQMCTVLCCQHCGKEVTNKNDVFSMAAEGPLGAYVNPGGHVHDTLTVHRARGLQLVGHPSSQHSWFPGYAWTIAQCEECFSHMGWRFTATNKKLLPQKFWGLCRASLIPGLRNSEGKKEESAPMIL